jgi:predicted kinase
MVRAKVAGLQLAQNRQDAAAAERLQTYLSWTGQRFAGMAISAAASAAASDTVAPGQPRLILMCGLSGSGKSHVAARLVPELSGLRLRSDVLRGRPARRERAAPNTSRARLGHDGSAAVGRGRYAPRKVSEVYERLNTLADELLRWGETVILDATFLDGARRRAALDVAERAGVPAVVLYCDAPYSLLRERVAARQAEGRDPSEAGLEVLHAQHERFEAPGRDEPVVRVDTSVDIDAAALSARLQAV